MKRFALLAVVAACAGPSKPMATPESTKSGASDDGVTGGVRAGDGGGGGPQVTEDPCAGGQIIANESPGADAQKTDTSDNMPAPGPKGSGSIDPSAIHTVVKAHLGEIKACYDKELAGAPTMAGKATVVFTIGIDGKVVKATATLDGLTPAVGTCLEQAFLALQFAKPTGGTVSVKYPLTFAP